MAAHLPYIDAQPAAPAISAAQNLVLAEVHTDHQTTTHPSLPAAYEPNFTPALAAEIDRLANGEAKPPGIDMTRYDSLDAPENADTTAWTSVLRQAYASREYLQTWQTNLSLMEVYGKNAWLIGNDALEQELRALEREVEAVKIERERLEQERRTEQAGVLEELRILEDGWRRGISRLIETQVAGERLRLEGLNKMRMGAK
ncbi:hypothetical protein MBLNU230_g3851t1 [Neophaeotheca triangularis]